MKEFNKLVRDKIPQIIENNHETAVTRILDTNEYLDELNKKLQEEVQEYLESKEAEELCDVVEVIYAILKGNNINIQDFEKMRLAKVEKRGAFDQRIFLEKTYENDCE